MLPILGLLFLSERFRWFALNEHKNWTVLIAVALACLAVVLLLLWLGVSLVFRRRFQFSIRSLLLFVAVVAVVCSWFAVRMQQARRQREAVEAIVKAEGASLYDYQIDADGFFPGTLEPPEPPWLRNLVGVDFLSDVAYVLHEQVTDTELGYLKALTSLETLHLRDTQVTDAGLAHVRGLTSLQNVDLSYTQVTGAGLVHLKKLTSLQHLYLSGTQVTDAGLVHLERLTSLETLYLTRTKVTDKGLVHLRGLTSLKTLDLIHTEVTDEGVRDLQKALPDRWIRHRLLVLPLPPKP